MSQNFGTPNGYLCVRAREGSPLHVDVAFLPVIGRVSVQECVDYLKKNCCEIVNTHSLMELLSVIDDKLPANVVVLTKNGVMTIARNFMIELTSGFLEEEEGHLLLCKRASTFSMSDLFPKGPFVGECKMIEPERYY